MSQRLKIPPGYEVHQRGDLSTVIGPRGKRDEIPTDDAEERTWRAWLKRRRVMPDPVPVGAVRWLCRLFAERTGLGGHGQRASARYLHVSERAMRYYCAGRTMPHDLAQRLLDAINSPAVDVTA